MPAGRHHSKGFVRTGFPRSSHLGGASKRTTKKDQKCTITIRDHDTHSAAGSVARARFCMELLWLVALFALDQAGLLGVPLLARSTITHPPLQLQATPAVEELDLVAKDTTEELTVEELEDEEDSSEWVCQEKPDVNHEQYEQFIRNTAKSLPALAAATPAPRSKNGGGLRQSLLKRGLARGVILHGMAALHSEVARDAARDSRASLALADFHKVEGEFVSDDGEKVEPGTPEWKRLCRVVSFLKRNADSSVA